MYVIGKLIKPYHENIRNSDSQDWIIEVYVNHGYMDDKKTRGIILIPSGDPSRHEVKVYKDYSSLMAGVL